MSVPIFISTFILIFIFIFISSFFSSFFHIYNSIKMGQKIKLCLVYRDMWQSSGKYMPRKDQLVRIAEAIVEMGCFHRVETNGGGFEQINLLYGENPNHSVRAWTKPFHDAGIQTQMLERGLNGIRMNPVPKDVRRMMFKVKKAQGTDIARSFDGLNDVRNLQLSIDYAKEAGMISQGALSITYSPIHTVDYFVKMADDLIEMGTEEICIKDMAGVGRPVFIGKIVAGIRERHPDITIQYHGHSTTGFSIVSTLEAVRGGANIVDVGMEPLSWGTGHADLLSVHEMLRDAGYEVEDINMEAYMKARSLSMEFLEDFLKYFSPPANRRMNSLIIKPGLPGGMMGSLMTDLEERVEKLNKSRRKKGLEELVTEEVLIKLFDEVAYIWPKMGYPPLVTPFSQYVKNTALMNVLQMIKGRDRWTIIDDNTWDMMMGRAGRLPGPLAPELVELAKAQNREFFKEDPQTLYPDALPQFRAEMQENGWDLGQDEEELFEFAMHAAQYKNYKSGKAKSDFEETLAKKKAEEAPAPADHSLINENGHAFPAQPKNLQIEVNGASYEVKVSYGESAAADPQSQAYANAVAPPPAVADATGAEVIAPLEGTFYLVKDNQEKAKEVGQTVKKGDVIGYIEAMKSYNAITAETDGTISWLADVGSAVDEDDVIAKVK